MPLADAPSLTRTHYNNKTNKQVHLSRHCVKTTPAQHIKISSFGFSKGGLKAQWSP